MVFTKYIVQIKLNKLLKTRLENNTCIFYAHKKLFLEHIFGWPAHNIQQILRFLLFYRF